MTTISYAITACNEHDELDKLLTLLTKSLTPDDEIVVVLDDSNTTDQVNDVCTKYTSLSNFYVYVHPLNNNFATHKNFLNSKCSKSWIFNIDADEYPNEELLANLKDILSLNDHVDIISVPRVNVVDGLTDAHVHAWRWHVDEKNRVNWPDYQMRLYKNKSYIQWKGEVHEKPVGWKVGSHLPIETDDFALMHIKNIDKQVKQNNYYNTIKN